MDELNDIIIDIKDKSESFGYLLAFRYMNLCVKAEAVALLSATILDGGVSKELEECARVGIPNAFRFEIYPLRKELLPAITAGIMSAHPEFKVSTSHPEDVEDKEYQKLVLDMPEVDDDRYDVLTQGVKLLFDEYIAKLDMLKAQALGEIALHASGHSAERVDTAKKDIDEIYDDCKQHAEQIKTMKLDEIEEAHQHYLEKKQAEMDMQAESNSAAGSVLNYKLGETED